MKWVEFSNMPPTFELCNTADGMCIVRFYCDVQSQERSGNDDNGDLTVYKAICYEMTTRRSANQSSRIESNYDAWLAKAKEQDGGLNAIKGEKILKSKVLLAEHLASHPLVSTAHNGIAGTYSVTEEKQSLMTGQYVSYQAEKLANPNAVLTWNETGKSCEVWTEAEFLQLVVEIKQYVYPLVSHQQAIEESIHAAQTLDEIEAIVISYDNI